MLSKEHKSSRPSGELLKAAAVNLPPIQEKLLDSSNAEADRHLLAELWRELGTSEGSNARFRFILNNVVRYDENRNYDPRELNQPYPCGALSQKGYTHNQRIEVLTPFKYLLYDAQFVDKERSRLLLPAQIEGGVDQFSGEERCCEDCLILLKLDVRDGKFKQIDVWKKEASAPARYFSNSFEYLGDGEVRMKFFLGHYSLEERRFRVEGDRIVPVA